jgi:uncharacterized FlaG/YvyC family protein
MASDGDTITLLALPAQASQTAAASAAKPKFGKPVASSTAATATAEVANSAAKYAASVSASGKAAFAVPPVAKTSPPPVTQPDLRSLVSQLNKNLNDSGRPDQFRVDPQSNSMIQEVNPSTGAVIAQFSASEFPALARSAGAAAGLLIDSLA